MEVTCESKENRSLPAPMSALISAGQPSFIVVFPEASASVHFTPSWSRMFIWIDQQLNLELRARTSERSTARII